MDQTSDFFLMPSFAPKSVFFFGLRAKVGTGGGPMGMLVLVAVVEQRVQMGAKNMSSSKIRDKVERSRVV